MDQLCAPDPPDTAPTYELDFHEILDTHLGRRSGAPEQDDEWDGWVGNYQAPDPDFDEETDPVYSEGFTVITQDVPDAARDEVAATRTVSYIIDPLDGYPSFA